LTIVLALLTLAVIIESVVLVLVAIDRRTARDPWRG
jgi:uncharacterized membrane protein YsdA (DUF1294 family)